MIKIQSNGSTVRPNVVNSRVTNNSVDLQTEAQGRGQIARGLGALNEAYAKNEIQADQKRMFRAENEYNRRIAELKQEISENWRLEEAEGATTYFKDREQKIRSEVYGNAGIKYAVTQDEFNLRQDRSHLADWEAMRNYEQKNVDVGFKTTLDNDNTNEINRAISSPNFQDAVGVSERLKENSGKYAKHFSKESAEAYQRSWMTKLVQSGVYQAISTKDWGKVDQYLNTFGGEIDQTELLALKAQVELHKQANISFSTFNSTVNLNDYAGSKNAYLSGRRAAYGGGANVEGMMGKASQQLGKPYALGADGTTHTDCGKFIQDVSNAPMRTVDDMFKSKDGTGETFSDSSKLKRGDIVYYKNTSSQAGEAYKNITHAGIYLGDGKIIHAGSSKGVSEANMNDIGEIAGFSSPFLSGGQAPDAATEAEWGKEFDVMWNQKKGQQTIARNEATEGFLNEAFLLQQSGNLTPDSLVSLTYKWSKGDTTLQRELTGTLNKMIKALTAPPSQSDNTIYASLYQDYLDGNLTMEQVTDASSNGLLNESDTKQMIKYAVDNAHGNRNTSEKNIDQIWSADIDATFPGIKNKEKRDKLKAIIGQELYSHGQFKDNQERLAYARNYIAQEKERSGSVMDLYTDRSQEVQTAKNQFGEAGADVYDLAVLGNQISNPRQREVNQSEVANTMNYIAIRSIGSKTPGSIYYGQASYELAWREMVNQGIPFTIENYEKTEGIIRQRLLMRGGE